MLLPFGTRGVWLGHLRGPPEVTGGEWLGNLRALGEGVWRRPGTQRAFELQQPGGEQSATVPREVERTGSVLGALWKASPRGLGVYL